ncbi:MAG: NAD-dependent epimerase/dehydratase family protein, partial [Bacteroidia bacterium]|nr:NAD-dependent epimerase/dehydratase family protein [Bacteroidia bacterium]
MKKIIVTGGAGFIGSAVIQELQKFGHDIYVIDDLSFGNRQFIQIPDEKFFETDILDTKAVSDIIEQIQPNYIVHLAAVHFIPYCNQHPYKSSNINILGTINIMEAARKLPSLEKFFFASTAAVYPIYDEAIRQDLVTVLPASYGLYNRDGDSPCSDLYQK